MGLLLDGGAELEELLGHRLLGGSEDVDEAGREIVVSMGNVRGREENGNSRSGVGLVVLGEESNGLALLAGTAGTTDTVDVVLDGQGELENLLALGHWR